MFFACLLAFNIFITPIAAIASTYKRTAVKQEAGARSQEAGAKSAAADVFAKPLDPSAPALPAAAPAPAPLPPPPGAVTATLTASLLAIDGGIDTDADGKADPSATVGVGGDTIAYKLLLTNTTGADATGLSIVNPLDTHTTLVSLNSTPVAFDVTQPAFNEDAPAQTITLTGQDPDGSNVTFIKVSDPTKGTLGSISAPVCASGVCTATVNYTPTANLNGSDSFTYKVNDGAADSNQVGTVSITINAVNDAPTFTVPAGNPPAVNEDAGAQTVTNYISGIRPAQSGNSTEDTQQVSFVITNVTHSALFSVQPVLTVSNSGNSPFPLTANLTYTPAANANGTSVVTYHLHDNGGTSFGGVDNSADQTFTITVNAVNDAPVAVNTTATVQANMKISGLSVPLTIAGGVTDPDVTNANNDSASADNTYFTGTPPVFTLTSGSLAPGSVGGSTACAGTGTISNINLSTGTFNYDPPPGFSGTCTLVYTITDNGNPGTAISAPAKITLTINGPLIWFVQPGRANDGNGTLSDTGSAAGAPGPFNSLASASAKLANLATNQKVFVYTGTLTGSSQVLDLKADNDWLVGQGTVASSFDAFFGLTGGNAPPAGTFTRPTLNSSAATAFAARPTISGTVTMRNNTQVTGFNSVVTGSDVGLKGIFTAGTSLIKDVSATSATGLAVDLSGTQTITYETSDNTNSPNVLNTSSTGGGISVVNSTIGANGFTFRSISAGNGVGGPAKGIALSSTGGGPFTVTGDGSTANSGGTIQHTSGASGTFTQNGTGAIDIRSGSGNYTFNFMRVLAPGGDGFFVYNCTGTTAINKTTVDHNSAVVASSYGLRFENHSGTPTLTLDGVAFKNKLDGTTAASVSAQDTGGVTVNVQDSNTGDGFPNSYTNLFGSGFVLGCGDNAGGSGTCNLNVSNGSFVAAANGVANLELDAQQSSTVNFNIHDNTFDQQSNGATFLAGMINVQAFASGKLGSPNNPGIINNNIIKNLGTSGAVLGYQAIRVAPDICSTTASLPCDVLTPVTQRVKITNNNITNVWQTAVNISARGHSNLNLDFSGNIVGTLAAPVGKSNRRGVLMETQADSNLYTTITNNTIVNAGTSNSNSALSLRAGTDNVEGNATGLLAATMSGNTIKNSDTASVHTGGWFRAETVLLGSGVAAGNLCLDYLNNTLKNNADANDASKEFNLVRNSTGTLSRRNGGGNIGTETTSGTITTIATPCQQPSFAMLMLPGQQKSTDPQIARLDKIFQNQFSDSSLSFLNLEFADRPSMPVANLNEPILASAQTGVRGEEVLSAFANGWQIANSTLIAEAKTGAVQTSETAVDPSNNSLSSFAKAIASMIEPTAHAEEAGKTGARSQESGVGNQDSHVRLNHSKAEGSDQRSEVRNHRELIPAIFMPMMFNPPGQFPINGTGSGFTLPNNKTITITFKATLNSPPALTGVPPASPKVSAKTQLTGSFTGNPINIPGPTTADTVDVPVDLYDSTTTITGASPSNSTNTGQSVTFTAAIGTTGTPNGSATNRTGTVKFQDNGVDISGCTAQAVSSNQATCTTSGLSTGTHNNIKAIYSGDGSFDPSTSAAFTQTVTQNGTTTAVTSSQNPSVLTQNVTFTATVTSTGAVNPPTGTIQFHEGATNFGAPVTLTTGGGCPATKACASFSKSDLSAGSHTISGDYNPDSAFTSSTGSVSQQVNQSDVTVAVSSSQNPSLVNQGVSFTAQVSSNTVVTGPPTGTIQFKDGASNIGSPVTLTTGGGCPVNKSCATSITVSNLTAGNHTITAVYSGDTNFAGLTGTLSGGQQVNKSDTTTAVGSSLNPSILGNSVKFTATVTSNTAVTGPPAGKAQFFDGANPITCTDTGNGESNTNTGETLNGSGVATCTTTTLTLGSHNITAIYTGDGSANGSATFNTSTTSPPLVQVVNTACTTPITVMNTNDSGAGSLRQALIDVCDPGVINFDAGAFAAPGPYTINLADTADNKLLVDKSVTINGPGSTVLTVKRINAATNNFRVFEIASGKTVSISGMTISNGSILGTAGAPNGGVAFGGGISNAGTLTLTNVVVSGNSATGGAGANGVAANGGNGGAAQGGGIFNSFSLTLVNSTVSGNTATGGTGGNTDTPADQNGNGGAAQGGGIYSTGNLTLTNSTIGSGNSSVGGNKGTGGTGGAAGSGDGGGVYDDGSGSSNTMSVTGSTINGNSAGANGGGIFVVGTSPSIATVNITNSTISGNHAFNDGGGISNAGDTTGTTTLTSVTITGNTCDNDNDTFGTGGGINVVSGTFTLKNTIVAGNLKGSIILQGETATVVGTITTGGNAKVTVTAAGMPNSPKDIFVTVANGDTAGDVGGKIRAALTADTDVNGFFTVTGAGDQVILTTRTAAANDATLNIATDNGTCAGLTAEPTSVDSPAGRAASDIAGTVDVASSFDLIGDASSAGGLTNGANNNLVGVGGSGVRHITTILNSALANNGGPTRTHALVANSVALDNGDDFSGPPTTDQRGFVRPVDFVGGTGPGDESDIGAYEQQAQPAAPNAPDLDAASDTGVSNTDNNTADTTPTFTISGVTSGATVELLRDDDAGGPNPGVVVASGTASGTSIQLTDPNATPDGTYRYTARQTVFGAPTSNESAFLDVTINTTTPAAPDAPDLDAGSDSGTSSTDNLTKFTNLSFTIGSVVNGNTVTLLRDTVPTTGFVVVATGTASGSSIQLVDPSAPQGTYVYKSNQSNGANSADSATTLTVVVDTTAPAAPGTPDLTAASDTFGAGTTGTNSDNITNAASRAFSVTFTAEAGSTVTLLRGGSPVTLGTPSGSGASSPQTLTDADVLTDNTYLYTVQQTDAAGNSSVSAVALSVVFDSAVTASVPDLQAASDSFGASTAGTNSDDLTKTTPRSFDVAATESGSLVELLRGGSPITSTAGTGGAVTLTDNAVLSDNTYNYAIRETDKAGNVNTSADLPVTIDTTADTPNTPDLQSGSDAGTDQTDNRTDNATHSFDISGTLAGNFVELLRDGTPVSSTTAAGASVTLTDSTSLSDGVYHYTARQTDKAGNGPATSAGTLDVTIDTTAPLVSSDIRANANPTSAASVDFTVTFDEDVTGVDATDFATFNSGGLTGTSVTTVTPVDAQTYTVTVNTGTGDGGLRLDVLNDGSIKDKLNIALGAGFTTGQVYTVDRSDPTVTSITRAGSSPTNASSVDFLVTFSEPVTGVDTTDFTLTTTGVAGTSVSGVTGSGSTRTVSVSTGTGDGTIKLNLIDDDTIVDLANKKLGGTGLNNGDFTTGEVYTIDKTAPTVTVEQAGAQADPVTGPASTTIIHFTATFNESVTGLTPGGVTVFGTAGATVVNVTGSGTTYDLAVQGMTQTGTVRASINASAAFDAAGNGNAASTSADNTVQFNKDDFTTFEVNSTADTNDGSCDPLGTGGGNQDCTLREAINAANADAGAETITFNSTVFAAPGPYTINLGSVLPDITTDMTITGPGAKVLTVKRNAAGTFRIFFVHNGATASISDLTVTNGNAGDAGGIKVGVNGIDVGTLTLTRAAVTGNTASVLGGGGIVSTSNAILNVFESTISGNHATGLNSSGGGIYNNGGTLLVVNSTISGNDALNSGRGGGILNGNIATLSNSTVAGNSADFGGGFYQIGSATGTLKSTLIGDNTATTSSPDIHAGTAGAGTLNSEGFNLIENMSGASITETLNPGTNITGQDPKLNGLADNGGPTMTQSLQCISPAIDKGFKFTTTTDQRGGTRPFDLGGPYSNASGGDGSDIGAFESQAAGGCLPTAVPPGSPTTTSEDTPVTITLTATYSTPDTPLTFTITQQPGNGAAIPPPAANCPSGGLSQTCTATVTYTPNPNFNGSDLFKFIVSAGPGIDSDPADVPVTVTPTNDPPTLALAGNQQVFEDAGPQLVSSFAISSPGGGPDESSQTVQFIVTNNTNAGLFSAAPAIDGSGTLTYTSAANASGVATITVVAKDNGGGTDTSAPQSFTITVVDVNDQPTFGLSADPTSLEDAGAQSISNFATSISAGPAAESGQTVQFIVTNNTNPGLFSSAPAISPTGTLTYTAAADANGTAAITVTLKDNGGTANGGADTSAPQTFNINVTAVNDVPSFVKGPNQLINEDSGAQTVNPWATALSTGPANESSQVLNFIVTNNNNALFSVQPAVDPSGVLTYTTAPDANGLATVSVQIHDNGGTANGGVDTSAVQQFTITVNAVNDAPVNTVPGPQTINENSSLVFSTANGNAISVADVDVSPGTLRETLTAFNGTITLSTTAGLAFTVGDGTADPTMTFTGTLASINAALQGMTFSPTNGFSGAASFTIATNDQGNTGLGGALVDTDTVNITVNEGGTLQLSAATYTVGENSGPAVITITRTGGTSGTATVKFDTSNGTATAGSDYSTVSQTVTFNDGEVSKNVNIPITDDQFNEPAKTVNLTLSNPGGSGALGSPSTAVLTINDDDPAGGYLKFSTTNYNVNEGGVATITVQRVGTLTNAVSVEFATTDNSDPASFVPCAPTPGNTLATSRCDFETAVGRVSFAAGDGADKTFTVMTQQDNYVEGPETLTLTLSNPTGGATILGLSTATLTINDDVSEPAANPVDDTNNFVESLYRDFLNRPSDPSGKAFWVANIDKCNDPAQRPPNLTLAQCISFYRVSTASAFFLSDEFQQTGGTAYLTNHAAFGNLQPIFIRFERDAQEIGKGYVFGAPGAAALLEANKVAYFNDYVSRTEFVNTYAGVSNQQYVDTLTQNTGVQWGLGEKQQLVDGLNNATETRATVLRKVTEKPSFRQQEMEPMFVLMEYFGFLRRNPDQAGFNFWLNKLHNANGDPIKSEMVRAFVESNEYRQRFGQ